MNSEFDANTARHKAEMRRLAWKLRFMVTGMVVSVVVILGGVLYVIWPKSPNSSATAATRMKGEPLGLDESSAQVKCEDAIRRFAKDPEKVKVPFVLNQGRGDTYEFNWVPQTSLVRMRNGLGLDVAVRASCSVSSRTGSVTSLTLDGQKLL